MKELFGGSESKSDPIDVTPPDIERLRKSAAGTLTSLFQSGGGPEYTGPLVAGIQPNEQSILNLLFADAQGASGRQDLIQRTMAGNFLPGQAGANPFLEEAIRAAQRPTFEALTETLERSLPGRFTQAGQFVQPTGSSAFDRAAAIATRGAAQTAADIATRMSSDAYEAERGRQNEAIQFSQQEVETTVQNLQAQALPRLIEDLGIERGIELFKERTNQLLMALQSLGQMGALTNIGQRQRQESFTGIIPALFPRGIGGGSTGTGGG